MAGKDKQEVRILKVHKSDSELPDLSLVTIEDCLDMREKKGSAVICNDGQVIRFMEEDTMDK